MFKRESRLRIECSELREWLARAVHRRFKPFDGDDAISRRAWHTRPTVTTAAWQTHAAFGNDELRAAKWGNAEQLARDDRVFVGCDESILECAKSTFAARQDFEHARTFEGWCVWLDELIDIRSVRLRAVVVWMLMLLLMLMSLLLTTATMLLRMTMLLLLLLRLLLWLLLTIFRRRCFISIACSRLHSVTVFAATVSATTSSPSSSLSSSWLT